MSKSTLQGLPWQSSVNTSSFNARGKVSIPGQETKIPHTSWPKNPKHKHKQYCNRFSNLKIVHIKKQKS